MTDAIQLSDIPDLSGIGDTFAKSDPFIDGWYRGTILEKRESTDSNGNDRVFASGDELSQRGDSRNIRLQVVLKRTSDSKVLNTSYMLNYRPEDLTQETVQAITAQQAKVKDGEGWGTLFRPFMSLLTLSKLQKIAGVRQLERNGNGGLNLAPLYNKVGYFRIAPDDRNPQYKAIVDLRETAPSKVPVL